MSVSLSGRSNDCVRLWKAKVSNFSRVNLVTDQGFGFL